MSETAPIELMIVEDNPQDLELAMLALIEVCPAVKIHISRDGAEAMDYIFCEGAYSTRLITDRPKVILLDLKLPKIDGLAVLKRLKEDVRTRSIPVVMLTSSREQRDIVESYNLGVNSYIVKPVNFDRFSEAIKHLGLYWQQLNQPTETGDGSRGK
jgi:CheY-like chemotaxis protein